MKLTIGDKNITISHDIDGNLFFDEGNNKYYLTISKDNELEMVKIENLDSLKSVENKINYSKLQNTNEKSLRGKILRQIEDIEEDSDDDFVEDKYKYCPEDKTYFVDSTATDEYGEYDDYNEYDEDSYLDIDFSSQRFIFSKSGGDSFINYSNVTLDVLSSYDTLVVDDVNNMTLATLECTSKSNYRVILYVTGGICLNTIGSLMKSYDFIFVDGILGLKKKYQKLIV